MATPVRAAIKRLSAHGPRGSALSDLLSCKSKGFIAVNEQVSESFPLVVRTSGAKGFGLVCGPRPARAGEEVLRVPPALWLPYCAEVAVRKAEAGAPDVLARLSNACAKIGGSDASKLAPVACLALELLFTLEREPKEPYLGLLREASSSEGSLPHPLLMGPDHLDLLQASPLRDSILASSRIYSTLHRSLFGLGEGGESTSRREGKDGTPSASSTRDFLWALGTILSRGVSEDGAGGTGLVPYLDFANHGDACPKGRSGGGGRGRASCERGFDPATGSHYLRALRDIAPGEELLIDYGSAAKGIYRFARTYGFIHFSYSDHNRKGVGNAKNKQDERPGTSNGQVLEPAATSLKDSLRLELPAPSPPLIVPVRLADVATAPLAVAGGEVGEGSLTKGPSAQAGTRAAAEATACAERLRRYPTGAEEDLRLLWRLNNNQSEDEGGGPPHAGMGKSAAIHGEVAAEWVQMCVALRAAEKIALERELRGREPPLD
eukprot:g8799.t1